METIRVNMTPCEDIKTIHASQNDNEAREWGFELHNNGEKIDSSSISDQLVFKAYEGGTEQILPENGSTPTTSPFKGDIKYPQGLLSDQEFLYRESPTEEDGLTWITDIKGNTLVWNQLVQNGNFADSSRWAVRGSATIDSVASNVLTFTASAQGGGVYSNVSMVQTHKYLYAFEYQSSEQIAFNISGQSSTTYDASSSFKRVSAIIQWSATSGEWQFRILSNATSNFSSIKIRNVMLFDLTQMGLDITASDFTSLFPLPYYAYNQGTLLSFMGNGIKTVGKNLLETATSGSVSGVTFTVNSDGSITVKGTASSNGTYDLYRNTTVLPSWARAGETYALSLTNNINRFDVFSYDSSGTSKSLASISAIASQTFTIPNDAVGLLIRMFVSRGVEYDVTIYPQIEIGESATSYEPYTSSTLSLPISTYFSNGMKSAGSVYDELTETKAITRVGAVDMGTLSWSYVSANRRFVAIISDAKSSSSLTLLENIVCAKYENATWENILTQAKDKIIALHYTSNNSYVAVIDNDYTDAPTFKSAMSGVMLYYELATETETSFTTASLVTENAEIPLSNDDGILIGKCTEELSSESGFFDAKIKLADEDGECYSNKLQLHVERSPQ